MSRKSLDESTWRSKNTAAVQSPAITKHCTVWPWNYIPDHLIFALGVLFLSPGLPLFAFLIGGSEVVYYAIMAVTSRTTVFAKALSAVLDFGVRVGKPLMKDERDAPYFLPVVFLTVWAPSIFAWALYRHVTYGFEISTLLLYHSLRLMPRYRLFAYLHVLLHKEGHTPRGFFKAEWANFGVMHWFTGLFYGGVPYSYAMAHNKIHHAFDNDLDDVHTNLDLDRSRWQSFIYYLPRFALYWSGVSPAAKFAFRGQWEFFNKMVLGMAVYYSLWALSFKYLGIAFTIYYVMFPYIESVTFFGGISYLWHAWCEPEDINNPYIDSVTILEGQDNIFNEDFHVVHHTKPLAHWTEYPALYEENKEMYLKHNATIFRDCEEGMLLYWLLAAKWDDMAEHMVDLSGKMNHEQKKEMCMRRLRARLTR